MSRVVNRAFAMMRTLQGLDEKAFLVSSERASADITNGGECASLFFAHTGRMAYKWTHYLEAYDEEFARYQHGFPLPGGGVRPIRMLEVGTSHGGSLQLWRKYFGPDAAIWGVDIDPRCLSVDDPDLNVRIGSQNDPEFLLKVVEEMGGVDIVLDDGSHVAEHQMTTFKTLFPIMTDGGVYVVEDLHTAYWRGFGGGYQASGSFIEVTKQLVDDMHAVYHRQGDRLGMHAASYVPRVCFYDSMVFIRKAARVRPSTSKVGSPSF